MNDDRKAFNRALKLLSIFMTLVVLLAFLEVMVSQLNFPGIFQIMAQLLLPIGALYMLGYFYFKEEKENE